MWESLGSPRVRAPERSTELTGSYEHEMGDVFGMLPRGRPGGRVVVGVSTGRTRESKTGGNFGVSTGGFCGVFTLWRTRESKTGGMSY